MRGTVETEAADPSRTSQNDEGQSSSLDPSGGVEGRVTTASTDEDTATPVTVRLTEANIESQKVEAAPQ